MHHSHEHICPNCGHINTSTVLYGRRLVTHCDNCSLRYEVELKHSVTIDQEEMEYVEDLRS